MKRLFQIFIVLISVLCPMGIEASSVITLTLSKVMLSESPDEIKESPKRQRCPSMRVECVITSDGVEILSFASNITECQSFEIWDADGECCIATYSDEASFIEGVFSMDGEFQVRFVFADFMLVGYV